jgi:hypothetical protein
MKCRRCQQENPAGQKFRGDCGARLIVVSFRPAARLLGPASSRQSGGRRMRSRRSGGGFPNVMCSLTRSRRGAIVDLP